MKRLVHADARPGSFLTSPVFPLAQGARASAGIGPHASFDGHHVGLRNHSAFYLGD